MTNPGWPLAEAGMQLSFDNAPENWRQILRKAIVQAAWDLPELIADDVWDRVPFSHNHSRGSALGQLMREAAKEGTIERAGRTRRSRRAPTHCKHLTVWRSLLY